MAPTAESLHSYQVQDRLPLCLASKLERWTTSLTIKMHMQRGKGKEQNSFPELWEPSSQTPQSQAIALHHGQHRALSPSMGKVCKNFQIWRVWERGSWNHRHHIKCFLKKKKKACVHFPKEVSVQSTFRYFASKTLHSIFFNKFMCFQGTPEQKKKYLNRRMSGDSFTPTH